jgi:hypothetical protein
LNDQGERLGFCVANTPPGNLHWNRDDKPGFADMMRII